MIVCQVSIRGHVQGVGCRAWIADQAARRELEGWVRNRRDSSVEAVFSGPDDTVTEMIEACRRGPALARVEALDRRATGTDLLGLRRPGERFSMLPTV